MRYTPKKIEPVWQKKWEESKLFATPRDLATLKQKPKYYTLDMFPYPSGAGLHVGHPEGYTATDIIARYKRMQGYHVLHPIGWDAFGLPAERAAMRENIHPKIITKRNINNFREQIKKLGFCYDWSREISTTHKDYYKFTQYIFLKLYEKNLAYLADISVNYCPALNTVLANEEVKDNKYVETGDPVEKRLMRQWMLKITHYAERLLQDLDLLDWPENVKEMQRNWIGKSIGAEINFKLEKNNNKISVFTTRADTIFGVTFLVLAPEHELTKKLITPEQKTQCQNYIKISQEKSEATRLDNSREKTGIFTGSYAMHPFSNNKIPIFIADYVLANYGTGAIMAVPSDDQRDQEFAKKYDLPIINLYNPNNNKLTNSDFLNNLTQEQALEKIHTKLEEQKLGIKKINYKLRDWLFSRQRYWGEPFPIAFDKAGNPHAIPEQDLPVTLPAIDEYKPTQDGSPPLARADKSWREVKLPNGDIGLREVNTMPQWAGSCWYYLRYIDPQNPTQICDPELEKYWMPVDLYIGGIEHAVLHLLYSRFWHKVLYDCGLVSTKEPFRKLFNQGMILAPSYQDSLGKYYHPEQTYEKSGEYFSKNTNKKLSTQIEKMSKSRLNVVNPDDVIDKYGADAMRIYELFMGPLEQVKPWQMAGLDGVLRFLQRVWRLVINEESNNLANNLLDSGEEDPELLKSLHKTIKKVSFDIENLRFNTAISQMMTFVNQATNIKVIQKSSIITFLHILSPFAPHICDELYSRLTNKNFLLTKSWPNFDPKLIQEDMLELVCQINGKKRASIKINNILAQAEIEKLVLQNPEIKKFTTNLEIKKIIYVKNKLINIVAKPT